MLLLFVLLLPCGECTKAHLIWQELVYYSLNIVTHTLGDVALLGEVCHCGAGFKVSKDASYSHCPSLCLGVVCQDVSSQLLLQHHAYLPVAIRLTVMVMTYNPLKL